MSGEIENAEQNPTMELSPELMLHRAAGLRLYVHSDNHVRISLDEKTVTSGPHTLVILDAFSQPTPLIEALRKLSKSSVGMQDWAALTSTIVKLYQAGILEDERESKREAGYGSGTPSGHVAMLNDRARTSSFLAGISEVVTAGDVVVDIGTGTGVLAIAAARAGAKHVYAVEAGHIGRSAEAIFEANGLADRITLLQGWSTRITLPERADVLVSEIIGNHPLGEDVMQVTMDARKRLLKPEAHLIPGEIKVFGLPVTIPADEQTKRMVTEETLRNWRSWYGIDFGPLIQVQSNPFPEFYIKPQQASGWEMLSEPILLANIDLRSFKYPVSFDTALTVVANAAGQLDGLLMYFELELGPSTRLSTHPGQADRDNWWRSPVWVLDSPLPLQEGDRLRVLSKWGSSGHRITITRA
jgi:protein arginine N-methyltransferase 1